MLPLIRSMETMINVVYVSIDLGSFGRCYAIFQVFQPMCVVRSQTVQFIEMCGFLKQFF